MLELKNVKVEYYGEELTTLNMSFCKGKTAIVGQVGSFKTTLMQIVGGIKEIHEGEIILDGTNIEEVPPRQRDMAYVGIDSFPNAGRTDKALLLPLKIRKVNKKQARRQVEVAASNFDLDLKSKVKEVDKTTFFRARLSLRKIAVAMFDEPFEYLGCEKHVFDMIEECGADYKLISCCDGAELIDLSPDYLMVLRGTEVLQTGAFDEVMSSPVNKYVEMLLKM